MRMTAMTEVTPDNHALPPQAPDRPEDLARTGVPPPRLPGIGDVAAVAEAPRPGDLRARAAQGLQELLGNGLDVHGASGPQV